MTKFFKRTLAIAAAAGAMTTVTPVLAQTTKVATINPVEALFGAKALPTALQQIETKYATQLKTASDRQAAVALQTKPLYDALDTNRDGNLDQAEQQAAVQAQKPQVKQIRDIETALQTEIGTSTRPVTLARIYVFDQLQKRYGASLDALVTSRQIGLIIPGNNIVRQAPGTDLTATVRTEIDKPLSIDPPATWQPTREAASLLETYLQALAENAQARAQQQAQQGAAAPSATPAPAAPVPATPGVKRDRNGDPIKK